MASHATPEDLTAWLEDGVTVEGDPERLLARASELVDGVVRAPYDTDDDGAATDDTIAAALRDATCAVVEQWVEVGESNDIDGLAGTTYSTGGSSGLRAPSVPPRAARILRAAGLLQVAPVPAHRGWP